MPSASVVIPTYNRPGHVRECLRHLEKQTITPDAVIVVDASPNSDTRTVIDAEFPKVRYLRNDRGAGSTATSRNIGLAAVTSDVVAFLDDDAYAQPDWLERLLEPYSRSHVGGVGGRALNGQPDEEQVPSEGIGLFLPNGALVGNFAADPGRVIEVDHLLGANMSFRTEILRRNGGIHDNYPGTCLLEESDIALRVRRSGWKLLYAPSAVVHHVAGQYAKGRRFDLRYTYYAHRNHVMLLSEVVGVGAPQFRRYLAFAGRFARSQMRRALADARDARPEGLQSMGRKSAGGLARVGVSVAGVVGGFVAVGRLRLKRLVAPRMP